MSWFFSRNADAEAPAEAEAKASDADSPDTEIPVATPVTDASGEAAEVPTAQPTTGEASATAETAAAAAPEVEEVAAEAPAEAATGSAEQAATSATAEVAAEALVETQPELATEPVLEAEAAVEEATGSTEPAATEPMPDGAGASVETQPEAAAAAVLEAEVRLASATGSAEPAATETTAEVAEAVVKTQLEVSAPVVLEAQAKAEEAAGSTEHAATEAKSEVAEDVVEAQPEVAAQLVLGAEARFESAAGSTEAAATEATAEVAEAVVETQPEVAAPFVLEAEARLESATGSIEPATTEAASEVAEAVVETRPEVAAAVVPEVEASVEEATGSAEQAATEAASEVAEAVVETQPDVAAAVVPEAEARVESAMGSAEQAATEAASEVTEAAVEAQPEVAAAVVPEAEARVEEATGSTEPAATEATSEVAEPKGLPQVALEFNAEFPEESIASADAPAKLAGEEALPPFVVESWGDAVPQISSVDKADSWTATAEEARVDMPHTFWQSAPPVSSLTSTSASWAGSQDTRLAEQSPASLAVSSAAPTLPLPPREGLLESNLSERSGGGSTSPFRLLPPPPPPTCSVGSSSPHVAQVVVIEELKDQTPPASAPTPVAKASPSPVSADVVAAAALALGHPTKGPPLGMEPKVKEYIGRENSDDVGGASDEEAAINVAGAADAEVDDDACELLLGTSDNAGAALTPGRGPIGDGVDSDSENEEAQQAAQRGPWHKALPAGAAAPEPVDKAAMDLPQVSMDGKEAEPQAKSWGEVDALVSRRLDKFFSNDSLWQQVVDEITRTRLLQKMEWLQAPSPSAMARQKFKVQVPEPYPGIQYRRSKDFQDRYPKYAPHGTTVEGHLEDNGEWLKVAETVYLPTKVGAISVLLLDSDNVAMSKVATAPQAPTPAHTPPSTDSMSRLDDFRAQAALEGQVLHRVEGMMKELQTNATSLPDPEADGCTEGGRGNPKTNSVLRMTALRTPHDSPESLNRPLSNLDEASRLLSGVDPINPFADTPRGGSPSESPLRARLPSDQMAPINPFSDTPPGGSPSVTPLRQRPPASI